MFKNIEKIDVFWDFVFTDIPCAAHVPPRCKGRKKCQCKCTAGLPAAISASSSKIVAKTAQELSKSQPGGTQDLPKSSPEACMRAQMRPRAPKKHPRGAQEAARRRPREAKSSPRASKLRPRQAQETSKSLQKRAWGAPKQFCGAFGVGSSIRKAFGAIFRRLLRRSCCWRNMFRPNKTVVLLHYQHLDSASAQARKNMEKTWFWRLQNLENRAQSA